MGDLEARSYLYPSVTELGECSIEISHAVDEHWSLALKVPGKQHRRWMRAQPHHRNTRSERFDREDQFPAQTRTEVHHVRGNVTTWHVNKVDPVKHEHEERGEPSLALRVVEIRGRAS